MRTPRILHDHGQLLTLADIARHFSLPESTARYYCKRFAAFLPVTGEGRRRRYRQEALAVIASVLEHMRTSRTASQVEELLRHEFACTTDALVPVEETSPAIPSQQLADQAVPVLPHAAMRLLEQQTTAMENIAASLNILAQRQEELHKLSALAHEALAENTALRREMENMRSLMHSSDKIHQEDLDQIRAWVTRFARSSGQAAGAATPSRTV